MTPYTPTPLHPYTLAQADLNQGLIIMVVGMLVVFAALAVLMGLIELINSLTAEKKSAAIASPTAQPETTQGVATMAPTPTTGHDPHMIAILTAAATAALRRPVALKSARLVSTQPDSAWARQGRRSIMGSHRPYRRR